jgi:glutamate transport system permease protein
MPLQAAILLALGARQGPAPFTYEDFLGAGKLIASILDYDLPFIPVVTVIAPICIGMCVLFHRSAPRVFRWGRRSPETEAVDMAPAEPGTLLPGGVPPTAPTL